MWGKVLFIVLIAVLVIGGVAALGALAFNAGFVQGTMSSTQVAPATTEGVPPTGALVNPYGRPFGFYPPVGFYHPFGWGFGLLWCLVPLFFILLIFGAFRFIFGPRRGWGGPGMRYGRGWGDNWDPSQGGIPPDVQAFHRKLHEQMETTPPSAATPTAALPRVRSNERMMSFRNQFAHPQGAMGRLAGALMAIENRGRNRWAISLLDLQPTDQVLEIGFGPGWAIEEMSRIVVQGRVAGVDASEAMVRQATRRNRDAIRAGRVILKQAPATKIAFDDNIFEKVLTVNSLPFWGDIQGGLDEIKRVVRPNGRVVVTVQPVWAKTDDEISEVGRDLTAQLTRANFRNVRLETRIAKPLMFSVIGFA